MMRSWMQMFDTLPKKSGEREKRLTTVFGAMKILHWKAISSVNRRHEAAIMQFHALDVLQRSFSLSYFLFWEGFSLRPPFTPYIR